jgi:hypothetical protein
VNYVPGDGDPSRFREYCGFADTGEWMGEEKVMKLIL